LFSGYADLYKSKELSDITIICKDFEYPVHRAVLCANSPVFKSMILADPKLSKLEVNDIDSFTLGDVLSFMYTRGTFYSNEDSILDVAEKYQVKNLKEVVYAKMIENIRLGYATYYFVLANQHKAEHLQDLCLMYNLM
jgi:hypothetical protein